MLEASTLVPPRLCLTAGPDLIEVFISYEFLFSIFFSELRFFCIEEAQNALQVHTISSFNLVVCFFAALAALYLTLVSGQSVSD